MRVISLLAALLCAGCLSPADERARLDETVGVGAAGGANFMVSDGLATIRALSPGSLELWASAPVIVVAVSLDAAATESWQVTVHNCMPGATLSATLDSGGSLPVAAAGPLDKLRGRWQVSLRRGEGATLRLAPPPAVSPAPLRFAYLSDTQDPLDRVAEILARIRQEPGIAFVLSTGDMTDGGSGDELRAFQTILPALGVPFFATVGNHEINLERPEIWTELFGRHSLHFAFRGVRFSLVDSASATVSPLVYDLLDGWLERGKSAAHVFLTHIPPLDPVGGRGGAFRSRTEGAALLSRLAGGGVDLTVYGHIHSYYAFENAGIPAYIAGGGITKGEALDGIGRHFLVVDVDPAAQTLKVRRVDVK